MAVEGWQGYLAGAIGGTTLGLTLARVIIGVDFQRIVYGEEHLTFNGTFEYPHIRTFSLPDVAPTDSQDLQLLYGLHLDTAIPPFYATERSADKDKCVARRIGDYAFSPKMPKAPKYLTYAITTAPDVCVVNQIDDIELAHLHASNSRTVPSVLSNFFSSIAAFLARAAAFLIWLLSPAHFYDFASRLAPTLGMIVTIIVAAHYVKLAVAFVQQYREMVESQLVLVKAHNKMV
jgi:hypothetical protein